MFYDNRGLVSFLVVMFVTALLVLITTSFIQMMNREMRQATDNELSTRAYYAAEAGIEDGLAEIRKAAEDEDLSDIETSGCDSAAWNFDDRNTGYSCRLISFQPNTLEGILQADESRQFNLIHTEHDSLLIKWHRRGEDYPDDDSEDFEIPGNNPPAVDWPVDGPPIMRVEIVSYPDGAFDEDDIEQRVAFLRPSNTSFPGGPNEVALSDISRGDDMRSAGCDRGASGYACEFGITDMDDRDDSDADNHIVRIRPFYNGTHYGVEARQGGFGATSSSVEMPANVAVVDVTGYATDVFRRLQVRVPIESIDTFGQDYVLLGDDGVCKVVRVSTIGHVTGDNTGCETED